MKLEILNNFDNEYAEMKGKVSKANPLLGILINEVEKDGRKSKKVLGVAIGKNIKEIVKMMNVKESDIIEFADLRG